MSNLAEQRDFEKRRSLYESNGAPTGICAECGKFYEESIDHKGKTVPPKLEPYKQHFFAAEPQVAHMTSLQEQTADNQTLVTCDFIDPFNADAPYHKKPHVPDKFCLNKFHTQIVTCRAFKPGVYPQHLNTHWLTPKCRDWKPA
jgi:hypothetical protein